MVSRACPDRCCAAVAALALFAGSASADFKSLVARVPGDANALILIDMEAVLKSPLAVSEEWKEKLTFTYTKKPVIVPPDSRQVVMAALIDPINVEPIWEVSVVDVTKSPSLEVIARTQKGYMDKIREFPAVWSPLNAYFIQFDPLVFATTSPADRQFAARWAARKPGLPDNSLSPYLASAVGKVGAASPIVLAIDLEDVTCATKFRRKLALERFDSLEGKGLNLDKLSQVVASIKGVTLSIAIAQEPTCKGTIDFGQDTAVLAGNAKPFILDLLVQIGAYLDDFEDWRVLAKGQQITVEGKLSVDSMRRLLSIVQPPGATASEGSGQTGKDPKATASHGYFMAVRETLEDLEKQVQGGRVGTLAAIATWMKRDASAISRLPILNVDPDLVTFAADISVRLNDAARVMSEGTLQTTARTTGIQSGHVRSYASHGDDYGWDGYDPSHRLNDNAQARAAAAQAEAQRRQATSEERLRTIGQAGEIFKGIKADAQKIRIEMTNRYQMEF